MLDDNDDFDGGWVVDQFEKIRRSVEYWMHPARAGVTKHGARMVMKDMHRFMTDSALSQIGLLPVDSLVMHLPAKCRVCMQREWDIHFPRRRPKK